MAYFPMDGLVGTVPIGNVDTIQKHPLGLQVDAVDPVNGGGRFVYLKGVASTVVGSLVTWDGAASAPAFQTVLAGTTANAGQQLAVATAALVAGTFGWYQIVGVAIVATNGTQIVSSKCWSAGSGAVTSTATTGTGINGIRTLTATGTPAANQCLAQIDHPSLEGYVA